MFRTNRLFHRSDRILFYAGTILLAALIASITQVYARAQSPDKSDPAEKQQSDHSDAERKVVKVKKVVVIKKVKVKTASGDYVVREEREVRLVPVETEPVKTRAASVQNVETNVRVPDVEPGRDHRPEKVVRTESLPGRVIKAPQLPSEHREFKPTRSPEHSVRTGTHAGTKPPRLVVHQPLQHTTKPATENAKSTPKTPTHNVNGMAAAKQTSTAASVKQ